MDQKIIKQVEQMKQQIALCGVQLAKAFQPVANAFRELGWVLRRRGYIRVYPPPQPRKSTGRRRSQRELRDIRRQRQHKAYGVWPKDFTQLPSRAVIGVDHASPGSDETRIVVFDEYISRDSGATWTEGVEK